MNLEAITRENIPNPRRFELDLYVIRGYQFFGISATTSMLESRCKLKSFEVLHRSNQIGGDESKAILVCPLEYDQLTKPFFKSDLTSLLGHLEKKLLIIGVNDWKREILKRKLELFIWQD